MRKWTVDLPNTDERQCFGSLWEVFEFLKKHWNLEHYDCEIDMDAQDVTVPAFAESRRIASARKAAHCTRYGCE